MSIWLTELAKRLAGGEADRYAVYGWIIDVDHLHGPGGEFENVQDSTVGRMGPSNIHPDIEKTLLPGVGWPVPPGGRCQTIGCRSGARGVVRWLMRQGVEGDEWVEDAVCGSCATYYTRGQDDSMNLTWKPWSFQSEDVRFFRLYDDDDILYYSGRLVIVPNPDDDLAEFGPLDDFGRPDSGCTRIDLLNTETGKWETV